MKKLLGKIGVLSLAAVMFLNFSIASASSKPSIDSFSKKTSSTITVKVLYDKYASTKVDIVVSIKDKDTSKTTEQNFNSVKLDSTGYKSVKVDSLTSGTKYSFKVKVRKHSSGSWSSWSNSQTAKTK